MTTGRVSMYDGLRPNAADPKHWKEHLVVKMDTVGTNKNIRCGTGRSGNGR